MASSGSVKAPVGWTDSVILWSAWVSTATSAALSVSLSFLFTQSASPCRLSNTSGLVSILNLSIFSVGTRCRGVSTSWGLVEEAEDAAATPV